jgi:hypothetical protein
MESLSPSTINVRLSAVRKLCLGGAEERNAPGRRGAASLTYIPNIPQKGNWLGNWLTRDQAGAQSKNECWGAIVSAVRRRPPNSALSSGMPWA